jgi:hypothetical protein
MEHVKRYPPSDVDKEVNTMMEDRTDDEEGGDKVNEPRSR